MSDFLKIIDEFGSLELVNLDSIKAIHLNSGEIRLWFGGTDQRTYKTGLSIEEISYKIPKVLPVTISMRGDAENE